MRISEQFTKVDGSGEFLRKYWEGKENLFVRYFTYFIEGLNVANTGKYVLGILGVGIFKSDIIFTWWVLLLGVVFGVPALCIIGRWNLFRANKARQFITNQHGNIVQWQDHNMIVAQVELLEILVEKLAPDEYKSLVEKFKK